jgi:hypothetical protein
MKIKRKLKIISGLFLPAAFALFFLIFLLNGCVKVSLEDTGTVKYVNLEGGFFGIIGDDGQKYEPINLKPDFRKDGQKVKFVYSFKKNLKSIHMWGKLIEIVSIRKI